jgi:hypothetical protein
MPHVQSKIEATMPYFHVSGVSFHTGRYTAKELKDVLRARGLKVNTKMKYLFRTCPNHTHVK